MVGLLYQAHMKGDKYPYRRDETAGLGSLKVGFFGGKTERDFAAADVEIEQRREQNSMFQYQTGPDLEGSSLVLLRAGTATVVGEERKATRCGETRRFCFLRLLWSDRRSQTSCFLCTSAT